METYMHWISALVIGVVFGCITAAAPHRAQPTKSYQALLAQRRTAITNTPITVASTPKINEQRKKNKKSHAKKQQLQTQSKVSKGTHEIS